MRNMKNRKRGQDKGFTLMEVLIAITILAIVVGPLLHSFVVAAKTNAKAKEVMRSTTLAQNVMEELKAYSLEEIARQFNTKTRQNYSNDKSITSMAIGGAYEALLTMVEGNPVYTKVTTSADAESTGATVNASVTNAADPTINPEGIFVGQTSGEYHFILNQVEMESAKFDVAIHVTKSTSGTKNLVNITSMNRSDCGYYAQETTMDTIVASEFARRNEIYTNRTAKLNTSEFEDLMSRTITIDISKDNNDDESVKITYKYSIPSGYTESDSREYSEMITIFDNYASGEELQGVYLYYYPLYGNGGNSRDTIEIVNNNNLNVPVFLIKMKSANYNAYDDGEYRPTIRLTETASSNGQSCAKICTNTTLARITSSYSVVGSTLRIGDLGNEESRDCLYDVEIEVYKHDTNGFTTDNYITSFTGSLLDTSTPKTN